MRLGAVVWSTTRGLGIQTSEFHRAMHPERTMVLSNGPSEFDADPSHYGSAPNTLHVSLGTDHRVPEPQVRAWLEGLDVVFAVESFPDWRMVEWARELGVATVCQSNAEFYKHWSDPSLPHPTQWWLPTRWRADQFPIVNTVVMPVPVALDRFDGAIPCKPNGRNEPDPSSKRLRVLHVAGRLAVHDRNGTQTVIQACQYIAENVDLVITSQDGRISPSARCGPGLRVQVRKGNEPDYWDLYQGFDVLVMPRRYGGLSLPVQEAMAAGLAVVMPTCSPNLDWPVLGVPVLDWSQARMPGGEIDLAAVSARKLANAIDCLAADPRFLEEQKARSREWASQHSWTVMEPVYRRQLEAAIAAVRP